VGNVSDEKLDYSKARGFGALSVFPGCRATVWHCTFTNNWSAVDDRGIGSEYQDSIFWKNTRAGGILKTPRYELELAAAASVNGCFLYGSINELSSAISQSANYIDSPDPDFASDFRPRNPLYANVGYRPGREHAVAHVPSK
jgi:hypothetical protein